MPQQSLPRRSKNRPGTPATTDAPEVTHIPRQPERSVRHSGPTAPLAHTIDDPAERLEATLRTEDSAEEAGLSPFERVTCPVHRRWIHQCIASPMHVIELTGHRWCRDCRSAATVAVDELTATVSVTCPRCGRNPNNSATRQIERTCEASISLSRPQARTGSETRSSHHQPSEPHRAEPHEARIA